MAKNKFYTVSKEINGKEYTGQFNGLSAALAGMDKTYIEGTNITSMEKLSEYLFKNVIVEPKGLTADDFESLEELSEVIAWAQQVMNGDFRDEAAKGKA